MTTPLFYACIGGLQGLAFPIGDTFYFTPTEDPTIHRVEDQTALTLTAKVPDLFARFLRETVIEPRFLALAERRVA
jgi:hypothetical protein